MSYNSLLINQVKIAKIKKTAWLEDQEIIEGPVPCRVMYKHDVIIDFKGKEVTSRAKLFFKPEHMTFDQQDKLLIDIENYQIKHPIALINRPQNSAHIHHGEVYIT